MLLKIKSSISILLFLFITTQIQAQLMAPKNKFTRQDTLRGSLLPERTWWDVTMYRLEMTPNLQKFSITGKNTILFRIVKTPRNRMQIDLQEPMLIDSARLNNIPVTFSQEGNAWFINLPQQKMPRSLPQNQLPGKDPLQQLEIWYQGVPKPALRAPWDGGIVWSKDKKGNPWIGTACQGLGASVWWPCKDHQSDEPDSVSVAVTVPDTLMNISNGRLRNVTSNGNQTKTYTWFVSQPINTYNVTMNIGKYVHFSDTLQGEKGTLDLDYYVLEYNLEKAQKQFQQVKPMLHAFEYWFGPYPFYEDGYKLVETSYLGMEHQSAVAYGNQYMNGYRGTDLSGTGRGKNWDFIIIHESGHEWFGNNISTKDVADMWVHEGFTNYSETLYITYLYGTEAGNEYVQGIRKNISNDKPVIGPYDVNKEGSGDMYYKASNLIHMIRQITDNDSLFRQLLRDMNQRYYHSTVTSAEIEAFLSARTGYNLKKTFDQYLRTTQVPSLEYYTTELNGALMLHYRWAQCIEGFNMPIKLPGGPGKYGLLLASTNWQQLRTSFTTMDELTKALDKNFYVTYKQVQQ